MPRRPAHLIAAPLRHLLRKLRRYAPLSKPVRIVQQEDVRCRGELVLGYAAYRVKWHDDPKRREVVRFRIVIDSRLSPEEKWDVVVHEWAHCLDKDTGRLAPKDCHDARWGQHYARAFRASITPLRRRSS